MAYLNGGKRIKIARAVSNGFVDLYYTEAQKDFDLNSSYDSRSGRLTITFDSSLSNKYVVLDINACAFGSTTGRSVSLDFTNVKNSKFHIYCTQEVSENAKTINFKSYGNVIPILDMNEYQVVDGVVCEKIIVSSGKNGFENNNNVVLWHDKNEMLSGNILNNYIYFVEVDELQNTTIYVNEAFSI